MTEPTVPLILQDIEIRLHDRILIQISKTIQPGEILSVMGPSGSGKSSLLAFIAGFLDPAFSATGQAFLGTQRLIAIPAELRRVGMLFQDPLLFPHMSVGQNLQFAIPGKFDNQKERKQLVASALDTAELPGYEDRDPATLSGGQKARIALMRTLLSQPGALLLDEPFSKLDAKLRDTTREFVFGEAAKRNLPVLLVTHDEADAKMAGGEIFNLDDRE